MDVLISWVVTVDSNDKYHAEDEAMRIARGVFTAAGQPERVGEVQETEALG